jgi:hypothetical protein
MSLSFSDLATIAGVCSRTISERLTKAGIQSGDEVPPELLRPPWGKGSRKP